MYERTESNDFALGGGGWRGTVIRSHSLTSGGELLETVTFSSIAIDCELN